MIFDEICKSMDFKVDYIINNINYKVEIDDVNKGLNDIEGISCAIAQYLQKSKGKINFSELINLYEIDSDITTLSFYGDNDETHVSCKIHNKYNAKEWYYDVKLKCNDSFNGLMSEYCHL